MTTPGPHGPGEQPPSGGSGWGPPAGGPQPGGSPGQQPGSVPPPPPGGQYPPPQGQFPQGQYPPQQQGQFPPGQYPPPQPSKGGAGKWVAIGGGILAVVVIAIIAFAILAGGDPEPGDCLKADGSELATVDCDDSTAQYRLVGIQDGTQTQDEYIADPNTCSEFPTSTNYFWVGEVEDPTSEGVVYCVTDV